MIHLTAKNFGIEVKQNEKPAVVMFYAVWCGKCASMRPIVERLEKKYGEVKFCEVEIEESAILAAEYGADLLPTFVTFRNGEVYSVMHGVIPEKTFEERINEICIYF